MNNNNISTGGKIHKAAHKLFLLLMFAVCGVAVVLFAQEKVEASLAVNTAANTDSAVQPTVQPTAADVREKITATNQTAAVISETKVTETKDNTETAANSTQLAPIYSLKSSDVETQTQQQSSNGAIQAAQPEQLTQPTTVKKEIQADSSLQTKSGNVATENEIRESAASTSGTRVKAVRITEVPAEQKADVAAANVPVSNMDSNSPTRLSQENSELVAPPISIRAADLPEEKNPKVVGSVSKDLAIKTVQLQKNIDGGKKLFLAGKALPDSIVTIYIFSRDPVVITLKTDADGNWSYALDKELEDGQHEAYVTVSDEKGRIVSKGEPLAFVKTAQAATTIPYSEFEENESPMERSVERYVLFAIVIMVICLVIALAMIGILTHKNNLNEPAV